MLELMISPEQISSNISPEQISLDILNLAEYLKLNNNTVVVSNIIPLDDAYKKKADEVSAYFKLHKLCKKESILKLYLIEILTLKDI